jgi:polyketide synthase 12/myxalamid-type polyketide synthase MxaB
MGVGVLSPEDGVEALGRLLGTGVAQATVAAVEWGVFRPVYEARANRRLLERIELAVPAKPAGLAVLKDLVEQAPPHARWDVLVAHVRDQAVEVLRLDPSRTPDPRKGLPAMGMDSLMAVELKNRLQSGVGQPLPATLTFEYPTIEALAGYLAAAVFGLEPPTSREMTDVELSGDTTDVLDRIEQLADEDVDRLLARRAAAGGGV